jgi:hypothetical protein
MTLGGRRVKVRRPRARSADDEPELPVRTYEYFADPDPKLGARGPGDRRRRERGDGGARLQERRRSPRLR